MTGFSDMELQDLDLKPYMDPALILDTLSPDDMEMWQCSGYNIFSDENLNSSFKDSIKEENIEMDFCLSTICPNDLLSNIQDQQQQQQHHQHQQTHFQTNNYLNCNNNLINNQILINNNYQFDSYSSSFSSSSDYSSPSASSSPPTLVAGDLDEHQQMAQFNIALLNSNANLIGELDSLQQQQHQHQHQQSHFKMEESSEASNHSDSQIDQQFFQLDQTDSATSSSDASSSQQSPMNEFNIFITTKQEQLEQQPGTQIQVETPLITSKKKTLKRTLLEATGASNPKSKQTIKKLTENFAASASSTTLPSSKKKAQLLPPSPPSSFGSDSDSDCSIRHYTKSGNLQQQKSSTLKANRLNNSLRQQLSSVKQRHQPYLISHGRSPNSDAKALVSSSEPSVVKEERDLSCEDDDCWPFLCSLSKLPASGPLLLTEEEKRTLIQEGHQVPSQLPLTKGEEKILKKIRRKIKNKISAQESRRKKKEYVDSLEKRMDTYINENSELKRRLDELARNNKSLLSQLQSLKATLESSSSQSAISTDSLTTTTTTTTTLVSGTTSTNPNQFATLLMVLVLFFAVVLGVWSPVFTKDHLIQSFSRTPTTATTTTSTAAATITTAATKIVQNRLSHRGCGVGGGPSVAATTNSLSSSAAATVTAVCAAASAVAAVTVKTEPESVKDASPLARSKTGSQIELTKVRPFLSKVTNKLPIQQQQQQQATNDSANVEESGQVIFLNIANSDSSPTGSPVTLKPNFNILSSKMSQKCDNSKLGGNYRVINTNTGAAAAAAMSPCGGGGKLPTIFRVINNNPAYLQQSIIKFTQ